MNRRTSKPVVLLVATVLMFGLGAAGGYLQFSKYLQAKTRYTALKKQMRPEREVQRSLEASSAKLSETQGRLDHLEQAVSKREYVPTLLVELEAIGADNGIDVTGVKPKDDSKAAKAKNKDAKSDTGKKTGYEELIVEVKGTGAFAAVKSFLTALEKFPKVVSIRSMDLAPKQSGKDEGAGTLELTIELRAFVFPPPKEAKDDQGQTEPARTARGSSHDEIG